MLKVKIKTLSQRLKASISSDELSHKPVLLKGLLGGKGRSFVSPDANTGAGVHLAVSGRLSSGEWLIFGKGLKSKDGRFHLQVDASGKAFLSGPQGLMWTSPSPRALETSLIMHSDGNLALRDQANSVLWETGTGGHKGAYLVLQNDGNLVLYEGSTPLWASNTGGH